MSEDKRISDLTSTTRPEDGDFLIVARQDVHNRKISFADHSQASSEEAQAVFLTGNQDINGLKNFTISPTVNGSSLLDALDLPGEAVLLTTNQTIGGEKSFSDKLYVNDGVAGSDGVVSVTGSDLHVDGTARVKRLESLEDIIGVAGATVMTDGRDPDAFTAQEKSLVLAYQKGVYITGSDLYVDGTAKVSKIESLQDIVGVAGATVMTDGRDPDAFSAEEKSLVFAYQGGVYITGADLNVDGAARVKTIESLEDIIGVAGATVMTDGRDPDLFNSEEKSLVFGYQNDVYVSGSNLHIDGNLHMDKGLAYFSGISPMKSFHSITFVDGNGAGNIFLPLHPGENSLHEIPEVSIKEHDIYGNQIITPYAGRVASITYKPSCYDGRALGDWTFGVVSTGQGGVLSCSESLVESDSTFSPQRYNVYKRNFSKKQHFSTGDSLGIFLNRTEAFGSSNGGNVTGNFTVEIDYHPTI